MQADIAIKRPLVKADIQNNIWNLADIKEVIDLVYQNQAINQRHAQNKIELAALRSLITDAGYQAELLAEETLL